MVSVGKVKWQESIIRRRNAYRIRLLPQRKGRGDGTEERR